ncbi:MAG: LysR family transcriptional regulator [Gracilibacteraceae bacterium]|jgi:DNA-binding transcriptional LysR family regulator|nr:LysR family transcriptional regulator [Gracilibacteraceae bacterium]
MRLEYLEYLICVCDTGSVNKAGALLHTSPQNVSRVMKQLENEFALTLFNRTPQGVVFTKEGLEAVSLAKNLLATTKAFKSAHQKAQSSEMDGELTVATTTIQSVSFLANDLLTFNRLHPKVKLSLLETDFLRGLRLVAEQENCVGVLPDLVDGAYSAIPDEYSAQLDFSPLDYDEICVFARFDAPVCKHKAIAFADLARYEIALYVRSDVQDSIWYRMLRHYRLDDRIVFVSGNAHTYYTKIMNDGLLGLSARKAFAANEFSKDEKNRSLTRFIPFVGDVRLSSNIVTKKGAPLKNSPLASFVEMLKQQFSSGLTRAL